MIYLVAIYYILITNKMVLFSFITLRNRSLFKENAISLTSDVFHNNNNNNNYYYYNRNCNKIYCNGGNHNNNYEEEKNIDFTDISKPLKQITLIFNCDASGSDLTFSGYKKCL